MVFQAHDKFPHMAGQTIWSNVGKPDEGPLFCAWDSCNWYKEGYRKVVLCKKLFLVDLISHSLAEYLQCNYRPITFYYLYYQLLLSLTRTTFKWISKASVDLNKNRSISSCNGAFKDPVNLIPLSFVFLMSEGWKEGSTCEQSQYQTLCLETVLISATRKKLMDKHHWRLPKQGKDHLAGNTCIASSDTLQRRLKLWGQMVNGPIIFVWCVFFCAPW